MTRVRFHREAGEELEHAVRWYEERLDGLGQDLLTEVDSAIKVISEGPTAWPIAEDSRARRFVLSRFPYIVIYTTRGEDVVIVAVKHARRRPAYWVERLDE